MYFEKFGTHMLKTQKSKYPKNIQKILFWNILKHLTFFCIKRFQYQHSNNIF